MRIARFRRLVSALVCTLVLVAAAGTAGCSDSGADSASPAPTARSTASSPTASSSAASSTATARSTPAAGSSGQASAEASESGAPSQVPSLSAEEQASRDAALATPEPTRLEGMDENSPYGASQVAAYFLNLYPYAYATGDLTAWKEISGDECIFCNSVIANVTEVHSGGGWSEHWQQELAVISYGTDPADPSRLVIEIHISTPDRMAYEGTPIMGRRISGGETTILVQVYWKGDHWIVEEGDVQ
ncbi:DUF6318 family protein [Actinomyces howellii]|nr:DUF6318 family protein [Actinomyces howellii]